MGATGEHRRVQWKSIEPRETDPSLACTEGLGAAGLFSLQRLHGCRACAPERQGQLGAALDERAAGGDAAWTDGPIESRIARNARQGELEPAGPRADLGERQVLHALRRDGDNALPVIPLHPKVHEQIELPLGQLEGAFPMTCLRHFGWGLRKAGRKQAGKQQQEAFHQDSGGRRRPGPDDARSHGNRPPPLPSGQPHLGR